MMQNLLLAATVLAFASALVFMLVYVRLPWYASPLGRAIMGSAVAVGLLSAVGLVRRFDQRYYEGDLTQTLTVGSTVAYLTVAAVWAIKTAVVLQGRREGDE